MFSPWKGVWRWWSRWVGWRSIIWRLLVVGCVSFTRIHHQHQYWGNISVVDYWRSSVIVVSKIAWMVNHHGHYYASDFLKMFDCDQDYYHDYVKRYWWLFDWYHDETMCATDPNCFGSRMNAFEYIRWFDSKESMPVDRLIGKCIYNTTSKWAK